MSSAYLSVETFSCPAPGADAPGRPLEGQQVVAVHGFASTPEVTWQHTGWVRQFQRAGATVHTVTMPYHQLKDSKSSAQQIAVCWQEAGLVSSLSSALAQALLPFKTPVHLLGYSLGARICWQTASSYAHLVQTLTVGGMPLSAHLDQVHDYLAGEDSPASSTPLPDDLQAVLEASPIPRSALADFTAQPIEPFEEHKLPDCPTLLFAGSHDTLAAGGVDLAASLPHPASAFLEIPGRNHISALTSGQARRASVDFIARHSVSPAGREPSHTVA